MPSPSARPPSTAPSPPARAASRASSRTSSRPARGARHSRESGKPGPQVPSLALDARFRGHDAREGRPRASENLEILVALPIRDVAAEAGELVALDCEEEPQEIRPQHLAELLIGLEGRQRLI